MSAAPARERRSWAPAAAAGLLDTSSTRARSAGGGNAPAARPAMSVTPADGRVPVVVVLSAPHYAGALRAVPADAAPETEDYGIGGADSSDTSMEELLRLVEADTSMKYPLKAKIRSEVRKLRRPVGKTSSARRTAVAHR